MAATTTIKVTPHARDRINARSRERGVTPSVFVESLIDQYERAQRFAAIRAGYAALPADDDYFTETAEWDMTNTDGLDGA